MVKTWVLGVALLCSLTGPSPAAAADYRQWLALLPPRLYDLPLTTPPHGNNHKIAQRTRATLQCRYSDATRSIAVAISDDPSGTQINQQDAADVMPALRTSDLLIEPVSFAGLRGSIMENQLEDESVLYLYLTPHTLATLAVRPRLRDTDMLAMANEIPWARIAATLTKE